MSTPDFDPVLDRLHRLLDSRRVLEALRFIEELEEEKRNTTDILRLKCSAHSFPAGDINEAYAISRELAVRSDNNIGDLYLAGQRAAEFRDYKDAEAFLSSAIDRSKQEEDRYYLDCSLLLRAYVRLHLQKMSLVKEDLDEVADDEGEIFWSKKLGYISKENLLACLSNQGSSQISSTVPCSCRKPPQSE